MSLIFSNETRILFNFNNKENANQLLELSYGNRVTHLKKTKMLGKFPNSSFQFRAKDFLHVRPLLLSPMQIKDLQPQSGKGLFAFAKQKQSARTNFALAKPPCPKRALGCKYKSKRANCFCFAKAKSTICKNICVCLRQKGQGVQSTCTHTQTRGIKNFFGQTLKSNGFQKPEKIKTLLPTIKARNFAFGSSFLFIIMTTILQRQDQNAWCFQFFKRQIPGVSQLYQESSLECFENITNSYIKKKNIKPKRRLSVAKRQYMKDASQIKNISFCKDHLYLDFAKPWSQQLNRDFACLFSKDVSKALLYKKNKKYHQGQKSKIVDHKWMVPYLYKMHAMTDRSLQSNDQYSSSSFLVSDKKPGIIFFKGLSNKIRNDDVFNESDTIPSKISCSANTIFTDNYKLRTKKQNKNFGNRNNIERKNDVLKKFFYEHGFFSIPTQALQYKKTSENVLDHEDIDKLTRENQVDKELFSFDLSLATIDFEKLASIKNVSTPLTKENALRDKDDFFVYPQLQKQIKKMSCYNTFSKGNGTLCNRFVSGYKKAEVDFRKSGIVFIGTGHYERSRYERSRVWSTIKKRHQLNLPLKYLKNVITTSQVEFSQRVKIPLHLRAKTLAFCNNKSCLAMKVLDIKPSSLELSGVHPQLDFARKAANKIRAYKKAPYKKLALNEYNEVKPLFEKINKEGRLSPHNVTFKKPLFIDYNDYLNRHKDSPAAIAISPSLDEDKAIDQAWDEYLEKEKLVNRSLEKSNLLSATEQNGSEIFNHEQYQKGVADKSYMASKDEVSEEKLPDSSTKDNLTLPYDDLNKEDNSNIATSLDLQNLSLHDNDKALNDEDKKREITKWEWLHNVRDSEAFIEDRKDLRKFAYPNKEALSTKRLKSKAGKNEEPSKAVINRNERTAFVRAKSSSPHRGLSIALAKPKLDFARTKQRVRFTHHAPHALDESGAKRIFADLRFDREAKQKQIEKVLVSDRKSSFFGITNLFPKRLIAKDQKQINDQILRDDYDRRSVEIFESGTTPLFKVSPFTTAQIEQFLSCKPKPSPLKNYKEETPTYVWKQGNYVQVTKGNPLYGLLKPHSCTPKGYSPLVEITTETSLQIVPRQNNPTKPNAVLANYGQHPIYRPSRRLRLRVVEVSKENNNTQSRADDLNAYQSHRWWQKRRIDSSLLGAPSTRYMVIPEITKEDWKKIIEWQLKTYFLEEEKRLQPLLLEKINSADRLFNSQKSRSEEQNGFLRNNSFLLQSKSSPLVEKTFQETLHNFKIKKIAIYLPWITLKKNLKKPYEWPLTRLTYSSNIVSKLPKNGKSNIIIPSQQNVFLNKKPYAFFVSAISPQFKAYTLSLREFHSLQNSAHKHTNGKEHYKLNDPLLTLNKERNNSASGYKPFLFEMVTKESHLIIHQLLIVIAIKAIFQKIYYFFGKIVIDRVKNSTLEIALLRFAPFLFNPYSLENQAPGLYNLKKRLKDLIGSEDSISSLSEIVWYLRNSCRGRMIPRGVVLLESNNQESTEFLKAIGGEAQVPVIVQSLRALPFTQNHPQRQLEKILKFAEKQAPCILFLDDLDSIGKSRTDLLNQTSEVYRKGPCIGNALLNRKDFSLGKEKGKWTSAIPATFDDKPNKSLQSKAVVNRNERDAQRVKITPNAFGPLGSSAFCRWQTHLDDVPGRNEEHTNASRYNGFVRSAFALPKQSNNICKPGFTGQRTSICKYGVASKRLLNSKLLGYLELPRDMQSLALQDKTKPAIQQSSLVPETEKVIEQRRLDLMLRLLTVMDGISHLKGVLIVTTSKNPSSLDPALLRPGRFEKFISLKLPSKKRRIELLKLHTSKIGHSIPMPWEYLGTETQNMTGTDLTDAINHSAFHAIMKSTPHTLSTLEYGLSRVNGNGFPAVHSPLSRKTKRSLNRYTCAYQELQGKHIKEQCLRFPSKFYLRNNKTRYSLNSALKYSQISFFNAGHNIAQSLFKQEGRPFQNYNTNVEDCAQNLIKLYTGHAAESMYLESKAILKNLRSTSVTFTNRTRLCSFRFVRHFWGMGSKECVAMPLHKALLLAPLPTTSRPRPPKGVLLKQNLAYKSKRAKSSTVCTSEVEYPLGGRGLGQSTYNPLAGKEGRSPSFLAFAYSTSLVQKHHERNGTPCRPPKGLEKGVWGPRVLNLRKKTAALSTLGIKSYVRNSTHLLMDIALSDKDQREATTLISFIPKINNTFSTSVMVPKGVQKLPFKLAILDFKVKPRKYFQFNQIQNLTSSLLKQHLAFQRFERNKDFLLQSKTCATLQDFNRSPGHWYRLYLPKIEQNKNNREWLIADRFVNQHVSLLDINSINDKKDAKQPNLSQDIRKEKPSLALNCFYAAFQNINEHRELLDLLADHLIRFQFFRSHEILRISSFYSNTNQHFF